MINSFTDTFCRPRLKKLLLVIAMAFASGASLGKPAKDATLGEISLLPEYCIDTEAFMHGPAGSPSQSPRAPYWVSRMGNGFWSLHHYCWGLVTIRRTITAFGLTRAYRQEALNLNQSEFYYVLDKTPSDFILLPEIYTKIGEVELMIFKYSGGIAAANLFKASSAFEKARSLKPDYWPAYSMWAEALLNLERRDEARELIEKGLTHLPDSLVLQELLRKVNQGKAASVKHSGGANAPSAPVRSIIPSK